MGPAALAERLDGRFEILGGSQPAMPARHRTLQDLVAWSYDLLDPDEQRLFARLCVFAGSFGLDAAEGVCAVDGTCPRLASRSCSPTSSTSRWSRSSTRTSPATASSRPCASSAATGSRTSERVRGAGPARRLVPRARRAERRRTGRPRRGRARSRALDRDFDNLRAAHAGRSSTPTSMLALRLVAALREYSFRRMRAEITGMGRAASGDRPAPRAPAVPGRARGRRLRPLRARRPRGGDRARRRRGGGRRAPRRRRRRSRRAGARQRLVLPRRHRCRRIDGWTGWSPRRGTGSPARLAHALYMRSVSPHQPRRRRQGRAARRRGTCGGGGSGSPTAHAQASYALGLALESTNPARSRDTPRTAPSSSRVRPATDGSRRSRSPRCCGSQAREGEPREALARYADVIDLWYRGGDWANQWLSLRHVFGILVQLRAHPRRGDAPRRVDRCRRRVRPAVRVGRRGAPQGARRGPPRQPRAGTFAAAVRRGASLSDGEIIEFVRDQIQRAVGAGRRVDRILSRGERRADRYRAGHDEPRHALPPARTLRPQGQRTLLRELGLLRCPARRRDGQGVPRGGLGRRRQLLRQRRGLRRRRVRADHGHGHRRAGLASASATSCPRSSSGASPPG